jgi:hypothetical protein
MASESGTNERVHVFREIGLSRVLLGTGREGESKNG